MAVDVLEELYGQSVREFFRHVTILKSNTQRSREGNHQSEKAAFIDETIHHLEGMQTNFVDTLMSKTQSGYENDAGYIEAVENLRKSARPVLLSCFCFLPFYFDKLEVSQVNPEQVVIFWGINFSGFTRETLLQGLFFICCYYTVRYLLNFLLLKLNYYDRITFLSVLQISGKNFDEIKMIDEAQACLEEVAAHSKSYDIAAARKILVILIVNLKVPKHI